MDGGAVSHVQNSFWLNQKYLKPTVILVLDLVFLVNSLYISGLFNLGITEMLLEDHIK